MSNLRWKWLAVAAIAGTYTWSFFLPATQDWIGPVGKLLTGWEAFRSMGCLPVWLANPLLVLGVMAFLVRYYQTALILGVAATLDACILLENYRDLYAGYYLWLTSMLLLTVVAACFARFPSRKNRRKGDDAPFLPVLPDPSVSALFNQPQTQSCMPSEIHPGSPPGDRPSQHLQPPPCSPSS